MSQETIERRFEVGSPARLKLGNIRGSIEIHPGEAGVITVTAVKYFNSGNEEETEVKIEQDKDGKVFVKTEYNNSLTHWFGLNKPCKVEYTVHMPPESEVRASGVSSHIRVHGLQGIIDLNTVSGSLHVQELSGTLKFSTVSGSIKAEKLSGKLDAKTVSGSIRVAESQIPEAILNTVSGSIVLETPLAEGPYTFKSVSGGATLVVPAGTACSARFHSVSGRMRTSLPVTEDHRRGSRGSMEIDGGGAEVSHHCVSGSLRIVTAEDEKISEQITPPERPPQSKNQMDILQKIQDGEISVDEALNKLNA